MTDKKPTDNDIKKALELCSDEDASCEKCLFLKDEFCRFALARNALDYINRLETKVWGLNESNNDLEDKLADYRKRNQELITEINRLEAKNETLRTCIANNFVIRKDGKSPLALLKAEAYKEFAERLKKKLFEPVETWLTSDVVREEDIDNLLKEMVGD